MFAAWGRFVHRWRYAVLAGSAVVLALSIAALTRGGALTSGGPLKSSLEAQRAANLVNAEVVPERSSGASFLLIFTTPGQAVDPAFQQAVDGALSKLRSDPRVKAVNTPWETPAGAGSISKDGRSALVRVDVKDDLQTAQKYYPQLRSEIVPGPFQVQTTGNLPINRAFNTTLESDLQRAEYVSLPVTLALLVLIFTTLVAALLPLGVGVLTIVGGVGATLLLARFTDVSQYALNIVTLIGLGVSIDYSLFVVNRFRDELAAGANREEALATTMATAGRAITFSGVTVAIGLSAMLFYQGTFLASLGLAGGLVTALAVLYGLTFLPALLAVTGTGVNRLRLPLPRRGRDHRGFWHGLATWVMRRPVLVLLPSLAFLLAAGFPFLHLRLAGGDVDMLPSRLEARQGYDRVLNEFPGQDQTYMTVVLHYPGEPALTPEHVAAAYDLSRRWAAVPGVTGVRSLVNLDPNLGREDYVRLYSGPQEKLSPEAQASVRSTVGPHIIALTVASNAKATSDTARGVVDRIRSMHGAGPGGEVLVTGQTAYDLDVVAFIESRTPVAITFVILVTYAVLFFLTGSVVLPLKAVLTNLVSIAASFGALVWVFQDGHFSRQLGFTPQSIDPSIPVIMFSIVFGLSMDYEVLLISRIQEEWQRSGDNRAAVAAGLERSGRLITGAAAVMVAVFGAFGLAEVVIIKAIGIGLAIAVTLDATVVRGLIVPAVMRLLGAANWWAPRPLAALHRAVGRGEAATPQAMKA